MKSFTVTTTVHTLLLQALVLLTAQLQTTVVRGQFTATIVHVNDHHSHLEDDDFDVDSAALPAQGVNFTEDLLSVNYGGFARFVSYFRLMEESEANLIKLHAGDALVGTQFYSLFRGPPDAQLMALACFDTMVLGNHEFDDGDANLANFIATLRNSTSCPDTPVVSANVVPGPTSPLVPTIASGALLPYIIKTFETDDGSEQVAIVGITIKDKTLLSSSPDPGTDLLDEVETATAVVANLTAMGVDKIIMLTHIGYSRDLEWMVNVPGVDVVVGGDRYVFVCLCVCFAEHFPRGSIIFRSHTLRYTRSLSFVLSLVCCCCCCCCYTTEHDDICLQSYSFGRRRYG
jgi:5'-nucleotidase